MNIVYALVVAGLLAGTLLPAAPAAATHEVLPLVIGVGNWAVDTAQCVATHHCRALLVAEGGPAA